MDVWICFQTGAESVCGSALIIRAKYLVTKPNFRSKRTKHMGHEAFASSDVKYPNKPIYLPNDVLALGVVCSNLLGDF